MTSTDPYAATNPKPAASADVEAELPYFLGRLRQLGATPDELDLVEAHWDDLEPADPDNPDAWTPERRAEMVRANDADLVAMIEASRAEYAEHTATEANQAEAARVAALQADARKATAGTVAEALAWVGTNRERAAAVLAVETGPEGDARTTLVRPLRELVAE